MNNYFKYLTVNEEDVAWGLYLNVAGISEVLPDTPYPLKKHPNNYSFNWENGRVLDEFQINYITHGEGMLETRYGKHKIYPGSLLIIFPGEWHRYRPNPKTGWTEHYIGFHGAFTETLFQHELFDIKNPIIKLGFQETLAKEFDHILQLVKNEEPGFQKECAGKLMYMLGRIISISKNSEFANKEIEQIIRKACLQLRDNPHRNMNIEELAKQLNVGYSYFRRMFKKYTGMSPNQYHLAIRIQKAKELILTSKKSIKQIAMDLGFDSLYYFSRIFKQKEGMSPMAYRTLKRL